MTTSSSGANLKTNVQNYRQLIEATRAVTGKHIKMIPKINRCTETLKCLDQAEANHIKHSAIINYYSTDVLTGNFFNYDLSVVLTRKLFRLQL